LNFVPEDWTDFIFATVGEAVGFIGCVILIFLYVIMILYMVYLSRHTEDKYGRLIIIGVMAMIFFHVFQNLAMTVGLMPITGIPLPFISYGGSNLLTNVIGISLVLNVDKNRGQMNPAQDIILLNPVGERTKKVKGIKKVKDKNRR
jgi:rod shape determining protein RodA